VKSVVVVGTGVAGTTTATTLRQHGYDGTLVLVGDEPLPPYRRTALSKDVLSGAKGVEQVLLKPDAWWRDNEVQLVTGTRVTDVRPGAVELSGTVLPADAVVLATGATPRELPQLPDAVTVRSAADADLVRLRLTPGARVVVVGAGFLGLEVASAAVDLGCEVTVLEAAPLPLGRVLPPVVAELLAQRYRATGLDLRLGVTPITLQHECSRADLVVTAIGTVPATALAAQAGAAVRDGVLVDRFGRTSLPGLLAAGDVAAVVDPLPGSPRRHEHWHAAMTQGAAVARGLLGVGDGWDEVPWAWSQHLGVDLQVCGRLGTDVRLEGDPGGPLVAVLSDQGRLTGAITVDSSPQMRDLRRLVAEEAQLDEVDATSR
jgi:3-phenylpropionate/trans-cinnamate dioxygenase ferredoxin reductase subunit